MSVYGHQGVSVGDANGDGLEDLYIGQPAGLPNRLYRNNGDGTFSDATPAELAVLDETSMSLFADVDNDGDQDLILIGAEPMLFRNGGGGAFAFDREAGLRPPADRAGMFTGAAPADLRQRRRPLFTSARTTSGRPAPSTPRPRLITTQRTAPRICSSATAATARSRKRPKPPG